jgi:CheY-like chemotaxis protein
MAISRVLVVEDNHEVRRMVTASIKTIGDEIEVLDVPSAEEALVVVASQSLDLLVIDIRLPGMSGLDMVARLRRRKPDTRLILVTGVEDAEIRRQMAEAKADACFFKPIDVQAFLEAVKRSLSAHPQNSRQFPSPYAHTAPISVHRLKAASAPVKVSQPEPAQEEVFTTPYERLSALKKQVKAVSALLVNDAGQILEEAGNAPEISTGSPLLQSLMRSFRSSLQVSQSMARGTSESLQYFAAPRQCIYVAPVGMNYCLFVVTSGYFGPDKLGMIYHAVHLAVRDLQGILAKEAANQKSVPQPATPPVVPVDKETLTMVDGMFSQAAQTGSREQAEGFWENVEKTGAADSTPGKEILTYEQARHLGLAPTDDQGS